MNRRSITIVSVIAGIFSVVLVVILWLVLTPTMSTTDEAINSSHDADRPRNVINLSAEKIAAAQIVVGPAQFRNMRLHRTVPGRLRYDDRTHIEIRVPTEGILVDILVKPGAAVCSGDVLARFNSPEVGNARADVLQRLADQELADQRYQWHKMTCDSLVKLVGQVERQSPHTSDDPVLAKSSVGAYREKIVSASTRLQLASSLVANLKPLIDSGAVSLTTVQQRNSELEAAQAAFNSVTEQSLFDSRQACQAADSSAADAHRRLEISRQHLQTILGYEEPMSDIKRRPNNSLSIVEIRAPFDGSIESQRYSASERVLANDTLFVLADTRQLWAVADVRERDSNALRLKDGEEIKVTVWSNPPITLGAKLYYVGREMDPLTNAVPLVASIDNQNGGLRPGQFVRMSLPVEQARRVLAVPTSSVLQHGNEDFVFIEEPGTSGHNRQQVQYRKVPVKTGWSCDGFTEIVQGIQDGDSIVEHGGFQLKSELLIEGGDG